MSLWRHWWNAIFSLRPVFSRLRSFLWFATAVAGLTVRTELLGVTSIVRALNLEPGLQDPARSLPQQRRQARPAAALWAQVVLRLFPQPLRVNGRLVLVGDGIKAPKRGKKMPAVKLLHQQSESNTKPEYIMGHSLQAVSMLVHAANSVFAVPLAVRIHEGLVWSNRDNRTLLDKMLGLLGILAIEPPFYFVADAYYAAGKIVTGLLEQNNHLRDPDEIQCGGLPAHHAAGPRKTRPAQNYGRKIKLARCLQTPRRIQQAAAPSTARTTSSAVSGP